MHLKRVLTPERVLTKGLCLVKSHVPLDLATSPSVDGKNPFAEGCCG